MIVVSRKASQCTSFKVDGLQQQEDHIEFHRQFQESEAAADTVKLMKKIGGENVLPGEKL